MSVIEAHAPAADDHRFERSMARARTWLDELQTPTGLRASNATGRYNALFGRDSLWSVLLVLEAARLRPEDGELAQWSARLAERTLRVLAETQGTWRNDEIEEQPGKIVHEYWPEPPQRLTQNGWPLDDAGRYYGSADGTYLFLMAATTVWEQVAGGRELVESLWDHVLAALHWALEDGDPDGDGLMEAWPRQPRGLGLTNQVWKDSGDAVRLPDGSFPKPPVAWIELQGYAIAAFRGISRILADQGTEPALRAELSRRVNLVEAGLERFWLADEGCPAMALTREKQPIPLVSSNIGHLLWCDGLTAARAAETAARLTRPDLLSAWGVRTLSAASYAFDPSSYHCGSIWPFDNAIAASALWRMGWHDDARSIGRRVLGAIEAFGSPVELYCALPDAWVIAPSGAGDVLYDYVEATRVQAWTAAAMLVFAAQMMAEPAAP